MNKIWNVSVWIAVFAWLHTAICHAFGSDVGPLAPIIIALVYFIAMVRVVLIDNWNRLALGFAGMVMYIVSWVAMNESGQLAAVVTCLAGLIVWCRGIMYKTMLPAWATQKMS